jgi:hypothetical protein
MVCIIRAKLKHLRDKLRFKVMVLLTTPASAARPETWKWLGERFAARREMQDGDEGTALAAIGGLLDAGLSVRSRPDDAAVA